MTTDPTTWEHPPDEIRAIRRAHKLSRAAFAAKLGVSIRTLEGWEQGRFEPSGSAVLLLNTFAANTFDDFAEVMASRKPGDAAALIHQALRANGWTDEERADLLEQLR